MLVLEDGKLIYNNTPQKTAECLVKTENPLVYGLPSSVRIYEGCKTDITFETDCPLTVKEGREWVASLNIKGDSYVSQDKHYEAGETAVSVKNVFFRYTKNSANVLENISFDIEKGRITALLGSNGAGKTTLLRLMSGIKKPISGKVKVLRKNLHRQSWIREMCLLRIWTGNSELNLLRVCWSVQGFLM